MKTTRIYLILILFSFTVLSCADADTEVAEIFDNESSVDPELCNCVELIASINKEWVDNFGDTEKTAEINERRKDDFKKLATCEEIMINASVSEEAKIQGKTASYSTCESCEEFEKYSLELMRLSAEASK